MQGAGLCLDFPSELALCSGTQRRKRCSNHQQLLTKTRDSATENTPVVKMHATSLWRASVDLYFLWRCGKKIPKELTSLVLLFGDFTFWSGRAPFSSFMLWLSPVWTRSWTLRNFSHAKHVLFNREHCPSGLRTDAGVILIRSNCVIKRFVVAETARFPLLFLAVGINRVRGPKDH